MKIIAKTKDYYDYLQGIYGVDEKIVYDRRDGRVACGGNLDVIRVLVNNVAYPMICIDERFRGTEQAFEEGSKLIDKVLTEKGQYKYQGRNPFRSYSISVRRSGTPKDWFAKNYKAKVSLNSELREPVLIQFLEVWEKKWREPFKPLHLEDYDFGSILSPHEVYIEISNFLSWCVDNPPIPDKQTDKEKVVSHGFDLKTSFRHRK